jgi:GT2 family glycosyltransferase
LLFPRVTVAVPTLAAGEALAECLRALESQTLTDFEVVVIDNSGTGLANVSGVRVRVIANAHNAGFGAAVNQAYRISESPYVAVLNDDAMAHPQWLETLLRDAEAHPQIGMFACQVRIAGTGTLDSTGMLIAVDGSSKQRGHGTPAQTSYPAEALFPSGSAAMYRREMLDQTGAFDESFFLYCEDVDLGLRARWAGWGCRYVAEAVVEHRYSHSAGRASALKAYYVERNRLYAAIKNFPAGLLLGAPFAALTRYCWHAISILRGQGKAAEFGKAGNSFTRLPWFVFRAHIAALVRLPELLRQRREIFRSRRITAPQFARLLRRHSISVREVAAL